LFGAFEDSAAQANEQAKELPEWPEHELLAHEKELLGFYVTGHPLTPFAGILQKYSLTNTVGLADAQNRSLTRIGGMISGVQHGVSKKSGKPYAMVTLEDLEGSVQILCMNENYDKYRDLLTQNRAILVIGEINNGDDKIFPQEIMPLEDAPRKFTKQVHFRLNTAHLDSNKLESVQQLIASYPGKCPLFLCFTRPTGEIIFMETHEKFFVAPSRQLQQAADEQFGEDTYYAKVDTSLPERQRRAWERKAEMANGEE
jgi:DNA polymerase-3 subunit alpha